jgi:hypothetical protein
MNAQEIINDVERESISKEESFKIFYPTLHEQEQANKNLTKVLKELSK